MFPKGAPALLCLRAYGANEANGANGANGANEANEANEANRANGANEANRANGANESHKPLPVCQSGSSFYTVLCLVVEGRKEINTSQGLHLVDGAYSLGIRMLLALILKEEPDSLRLA